MADGDVHLRFRQLTLFLRWPTRIHLLCCRGFGFHRALRRFRCVESLRPSAEMGTALRATGRVTCFLRKAAASLLEHHLVCQVDRFGDAFWFAKPRTPPLWQRGFFLINYLVLRCLFASVRSGVVKTFRYTTYDLPK